MDQEEHLLQRISQLEAVIDNLPFDVWYKDADGKYLIVNRSMADYFGLSKAALTGKTDYDLYPESIAALYASSDRTAFVEKRPGYYEVALDGKVFLEYKTPIFNASGAALGIAGYSENITERKQLTDALIESERNNAILLSNLPGVAYRAKNDKELTMTFISEGCYELTGYSAEKLLAKTPSYYDLIPADYREALFEKWAQNLLSKQIGTCEYPIITASGEEKWVWEKFQDVYDSSFNQIATEGFITDITERKQAEKEILYLSYFDQLTGLHNRRFFEEELERIDHEDNWPLTLIMADVNGLKLTNDAFGHRTGNKLLRKIAGIIKNECRENDIAVRIGGDEFILLFPKTDSKEAEKIVRRLQDALGREKVNDLACSVSFGWDTKDNGEKDMRRVFIAAEDQMYRQKLRDSVNMKNETLNLIINTLFAKCEREEEHCQRVSRLCEEVGNAMCMSAVDITALKTAGFLHDIGKIGVSEARLSLQYVLEESEYADLKRHSEIGYQILRSVNEYAPLAEFVLYHHERFDGQGFPRGLKGNEIPIQAQIISIANYYDAVAYRNALAGNTDLREVIEDIRGNAGKRFGSEVVNVFLETVSRIQ